MECHHLSGGVKCRRSDGLTLLVYTGIITDAVMAQIEPAVIDYVGGSVVLTDFTESVLVNDPSVQRYSDLHHRAPGVWIALREQAPTVIAWTETLARQGFVRALFSADQRELARAFALHFVWAQRTYLKSSSSAPTSLFDRRARRRSEELSLAPRVKNRLVA